MSTTYVLSPPAGFSSSQLLLDDNFTTATLDTSYWNPWMGDQTYGRWSDQGKLPSPYSGMNESSSTYQVMYNDPYPYGLSTDTTGNHLVGGSGNLGLIATPSSNYSDLGYSWASSAVSSNKAYLPATGGYAQWEAKMPDSQYGAWAGLWLLSSNGPEMDVQESGYYSGSANVNNVLASHWWGTGGSQIIQNTGTDLSAAYHTYGVEYVPGKSWTVFLDGKEMAQWTTGVPTNAAYELVMDLEMAGPNASGWHTVANTATHPGPFELDVSDVQVYSLSSAPTSAPSSAPATNPPAVTESLVSNTGASASNAITSKAALTGSGNAGAVVTITEGTVTLGTTTANSSGVWTFTPALADGTHTLVASETNSSGQTGSATLNFTLDTTPPTLAEDGPASLAGGGTITITSSQLRATDNLSSDAQETYTIVKNPAAGFLTLAGVATTTFTQADLDNNRVSYHEVTTGASSDSFAFTVSDAAGNSSGAQQFNISVNPTASLPPATSNRDLNGDGMADLVFQNSNTNQLYLWEMKGPATIGGGPLGTPAAGWNVVGVDDFNGDGKADLLFQNSSTNQVYLWEMNGTSTLAADAIGSPAAGWKADGTGDFNGDGKADIVFQNSNTNQVYVWEMNGLAMAGQGAVAIAATGSQVKTTGDFNDDGKSDIVFQNSNTGDVSIWEMNGTSMTSVGDLGSPGAGWAVVTTGQFTGDNRTQIVMQNTNTSQVALWETNGSTATTFDDIGLPGAGWNVKEAADVTGHGTSDLVLQNQNTGQVMLWNMAGTQLASSQIIGSPDVAWKLPTLS
ncbi:MAG: VCBS repeat-containing protein [Alphaproteobacteria bacterium]|nr:VCBS repeat-containing protein [Alphaproteobacteria bacterium]